VRGAQIREIVATALTDANDVIGARSAGPPAQPAAAAVTLDDLRDEVAPGSPAQPA
jgi:hypothetical protein